MKYGRIQTELRELLIKNGKINNLGRTFSELACQNIKPTEHKLNLFIVKLRSEFKVRIVYQNNIKTLYSATLILMEE